MVCDAGAFKCAVFQSHTLISRIIRHEQTVFVQAQQSTACMASHDIEARLCRWLLRARDLSESDHLPFTQEFFGRDAWGSQDQRNHRRANAAASGMIRYSRGKI